METELRDAIPTLPNSGELVRYARSPIILLNDLAARANAAEQTTSETDPESHPEPLPRPATFHKPIVNPVTQWQQPAGPFDPTLN